MNMKATIHLGRVSIEVEGSNQIELFDAISGATEVFGEEKCHKCGTPNIKFVSRKVTKGKQNWTFREMHCLECFSRLSFGQSLDGDTLFPKRKLDADGKPDSENGQYGPHNGWTKYKGNAEGDQAESPQAQPQQSQPAAQAVKGRR